MCQFRGGIEARAYKSWRDCSQLSAAQCLPVLPIERSILQFHSATPESATVFLSALSYFSNDLAIDLGTANTCVFARGKGIVTSEPSIVAINTLTSKIEAVGNEAQGDAGPHARKHRRHPPDAGRRDRRLRVGRAHAHLLHPQGAVGPQLHAAARHHRGARANHAGRAARGERQRLSRQGERSPPHRGSHGGGNRGGDADHRSRGQHGGRHRRRHDRRRGHLAGRHRVQPLGARGRATPWTTRSSCT